MPLATSKAAFCQLQVITVRATWRTMGWANKTRKRNMIIQRVITYHPVLVRSPRLRLFRGFLRIGVEDMALSGPFSVDEDVVAWWDGPCAWPAWAVWP